LRERSKKKIRTVKRDKTQKHIALEKKNALFCSFPFLFTATSPLAFCTERERKAKTEIVFLEQ
jgi:hypothetical protein